MNSTSGASPRSATFLLATSTASGHLLRILDLASQLSSRGHRVLVYAKANVAAQVKAAGAEHIPHERYVEFTDSAALMMTTEVPAWMPKFPFRLTQFRGTLRMSGLKLAQELEPILRRERVECVVYDFFEFGAGWAAERVGIPYASAGNMGTVLSRDELPLMFQHLPPVRPFFSRAPALVHAAIKKLVPLSPSRVEYGLPPYVGRTTDLVRAMTSPHLHIIMAHRGLAGTIPLRDNQVFVGPTTFNVPSEPRKEAPRVEPGTVVVSTTTTGKDEGLFRRVLEAIAPMNVPVLATAASASDIPEGLGAHVRIETYVPHDTVFPEARALITHGGWGTVGRGLLHGLPMLVIPLFGDQLLNAALVERAGLGRHLPLDKATPAAIQAELRALLADDALRARALRASAEIKKLKAEQAGARTLEEFVFKGTSAAASGSTSRSAA